MSLPWKQQCLTLLKSCSSLKQLKQIHAQLHLSNLQRDGFLLSEILRLCALSQFANLDYAQSLLYRATDHPIPCSWSYVIRGYACSDSPRKALFVYLDMRDRGTRPDHITFPALLKACAKLTALKEGRQIQVEIVKNGLESDTYVQTSLIHFYGSCQRISDALCVFDLMPMRNVITVITACYHNGDCGLVITACYHNACYHCYHCLLSLLSLLVITACYHNGDCGLVITACYHNGDCGLVITACYHNVITACFENSRFDDSIKLFTEMRDCGFEPDETTMVILLNVCAELGNLSLGKWIHSQVIEKGLVLTCQLGTALVDMYAKCGTVVCSRLVFDRMPERNVWTWSAMILGFAQHGLAKEALTLFERMRNSSIRPNYVTFLGVLCACSHAGLVDDGYRFFHDMEHVYGIEPMMTHCSAMVNILGRSGRINEAYKFIINMPVEPGPVVLRALLSACSIHDANGHSGIGEKVTKRLLELEPTRSGNFVMLANMYAEVGLWEEARNMRKAMRDTGLKKMAGESCVELGGSIHRFFSGYDSRVDLEGIYQLLDGLKLHMKVY